MGKENTKVKEKERKWQVRKGRIKRKKKEKNCV